MCKEMSLFDNLRQIIERDTGLIVFSFHHPPSGVPLWVAICDAITIGSMSSMSECVRAGGIDFLDQAAVGGVDLVIPAPNASHQTAGATTE